MTHRADPPPPPVCGGPEDTSSTPPTAAPAGGAIRTVNLVGLPPDLSKNHLKAMLSQFGHVVACRVVSPGGDPGDRASPAHQPDVLHLRSALATFATRAEAQAAIDGLHMMKIGSSTLRFTWAARDSVAPRLSPDKAYTGPTKSETRNFVRALVGMQQHMNPSAVVSPTPPFPSPMYPSPSDPSTLRPFSAHNTPSDGPSSTLHTPLLGPALGAKVIDDSDTSDEIARPPAATEGYTALPSNVTFSPNRRNQAPKFPPTPIVAGNLVYPSHTTTAGMVPGPMYQHPPRQQQPRSHQQQPMVMLVPVNYGMTTGPAGPLQHLQPAQPLTQQQHAPPHYITTQPPHYTTTQPPHYTTTQPPQQPQQHQMPLQASVVGGQLVFYVVGSGPNQPPERQP